MPLVVVLVAARERKLARLVPEALMVECGCLRDKGRGHGVEVGVLRLGRVVGRERIVCGGRLRSECRGEVGRVGGRATVVAAENGVRWTAILEVHFVRMGQFSPLLARSIGRCLWQVEKAWGRPRSDRRIYGLWLLVERSELKLAVHCEGNVKF